MYRQHIFLRPVKLLFVVSLVMTVVAFIKKDTIPSERLVDPRLLAEPAQEKTFQAPFSVEQGEVVYQVRPLFEYELAGLVVSYAHHSGERMVHESWKDHLNVADLCVVWGGNADGMDLNRIHFFNRQFTCTWEYGDAAIKREFDPQKLSNNHILATDPAIRERIRQVKVGDQIRFKGWLTEYSNDYGFERGTSITRTDTGRQACETIYIEEFDIIAGNESIWRKTLWLAMTGLICSIVFWAYGVLTDRF